MVLAGFLFFSFSGLAQYYDLNLAQLLDSSFNDRSNDILNTLLGHAIILWLIGPLHLFGVPSAILFFTLIPYGESFRTYFKSVSIPFTLLLFYPLALGAIAIILVLFVQQRQHLIATLLQALFFIVIAVSLLFRRMRFETKVGSPQVTPAPVNVSADSDVESAEELRCETDLGCTQVMTAASKVTEDSKVESRDRIFLGIGSLLVAVFFVTATLLVIPAKRPALAVKPTTRCSSTSK